MKPAFISLCLLFFIGASAFPQEKEPILIFISLDGFRHDYVERFQPENLSRFIAEGVGAKGLIPSFPTKTFPNHYTLATGLLPEHHGLVDNDFYEPEKDQVYTMGNRSLVQDGYWYGGTPIWVLAEQYGIKAASYFFVGTEAPIQGVRPSYYYDYDGGIPNLTRIAKVFEWLQLPESERPRLITLYFSNMDDTGHRFGPNNEAELKKSLFTLDRQLGSLFEGLKSFDLPIHVVIVSDHGMTEVSQDRLINLDQLTEGIPARVVNNGALAHLHLEDPKEEEKVIQLLLSRNPNIRIDDLNGKENYQDPSAFPQRKGDLLILPEKGYYLADTPGMMRYQSQTARWGTEVFGEHGYRPTLSDMWGIFYAKGPLLKSGIQVEPFSNVHVYPLLCRILGLPIPTAIDGDAAILDPILHK